MDAHSRRLNWNKWVRQTHRWLSIVFTVAVIVNLVAVVTGRYANWVGLLAVLPLALLLFTGLYLFVLPYATKWRRRRHTDRTAAGGTREGRVPHTNWQGRRRG